MGYVFDPDVLHEIGLRAAGKPREEMVRIATEGVHAAYPEHVATDEDWVFSLFAGTTGIMKVLHASITEYVIIYGTPIGTSGFSGRYLLDIHDTVLAGEMQTYTAATPLEAQIYRVGDRALLRRGDAKGWRLAGASFMLEYGRGLLPSALPLALGDALFSSMDAVTLYKTLRAYGKLTLRGLVRGKI